MSEALHSQQLQQLMKKMSQLMAQAEKDVVE